MIATRSAVAIAALGIALGSIAVAGLRGSLVYYRTPTEVAREGDAAIGQRMRLGGSVVPGTVHRSGRGTSFEITDGVHRLAVLDTAGVPETFAPGQNVVVEGIYEADGTFRADTVMVGHDDEYGPASPAPIAGAPEASDARG